MANWYEKFSKAADKVVSTVEQATAKTVKTYKEKGVDGIVEQTTNILSKTGERLEKTGATVTDRTQDYLKSLDESNKKVMKEVEKNLGKGSLNANIAKVLAATANTTQHVAEDLVEITKRTYNTIKSEIDSQTTASDSVSPAHALRVESLNLLPLQVVIMEVMGGKPTDQYGRWIDNQKTEFIILKDSWFQPDANVNGKNTVSLVSFYLSKQAGLDYNNANHKKLLEKEAVNVLEKFCANFTGQTASTEPAPVVEKNQHAVKKATSTTEKNAVKKTTPAKKVATKTVVKAVKPAVKTVAKKTTVKKTVKVAEPVKSVARKRKP